jgi:hypothetical protein
MCCQPKGDRWARFPGMATDARTGILHFVALTIQILYLFLKIGVLLFDSTGSPILSSKKNKEDSS